MGISFNSLGLPNVVEICPSRTPTRNLTPMETTTPTMTPTNTVTPTPTQTKTPIISGINSANYYNIANWIAPSNINHYANVTTVGTNGRPSFYGTYDQTGNVRQWNDLDGTPGSVRGQRNGGWGSNSYSVSSSSRNDHYSPSVHSPIGFRLASLLNPLGLLNFVTVGDINNPNDTRTNQPYGSVDHVYQIGQYPVTNAEYILFLGDVASASAGDVGDYGLYSYSMSAFYDGGITESINNGDYTYSLRNNMGLKPVTYVSWFDCARYCNWLHNNKGAGSTETGAYDLVDGQTSGNAPTKNHNAKYWIPTENEWYKAAYYKGGGTNAGYWTYATQSDTPPIPVCATPEGDGTPC